MTDHVYIKHDDSSPCPDLGTCIYCYAGVKHCSVCDGIEKELTTECLGRPMTDSQKRSVFAGQRDYLAKARAVTEAQRRDLITVRAALAAYDDAPDHRAYTVGDELGLRRDDEMVQPDDGVLDPMWSSLIAAMQRQQDGGRTCGECELWADGEVKELWIDGYEVLLGEYRNVMCVDGESGHSSDHACICPAEFQQRQPDGGEKS